MRENLSEDKCKGTLCEQVVKNTNQTLFKIEKVIIGPFSVLNLFLATGRPLRLKKNPFHSTLKDLFILKILKFLS